MDPALPKSPGQSVSGLSEEGRCLLGPGVTLLCEAEERKRYLIALSLLCTWFWGENPFVMNQKLHLGEDGSRSALSKCQSHLPSKLETMPVIRSFHTPLGPLRAHS